MQLTVVLHAGRDPANDLAFVLTQCDQEDNLIRRGANEGHTTSPDDFLKWDMPAGSWTAEPGENGVYGASEILDIDEVEFRNKYTWQPAKGQGSVSGHVFFKETACTVVGDLVFGCPGGGPCIDGVCTFPAANVQVTLLGGDNNSVVTGLDGSYTFPSVRAGTFEVSAYSQRDNIGELFPHGAQIQVTVPDQGFIIPPDAAEATPYNESRRLINETRCALPGRCGDPRLLLTSVDAPKRDTDAYDGEPPPAASCSRRRQRLRVERT